jgi:membrane protein YqaA with SNARE-associated domain
MGDIGIYSGLFLAAFVALIPMQSEAAMVAIILADPSHPAALLVAIASLGNVAAALVNWALGRFIVHFRDRAWFPVRQSVLERAQQWYARYGRWSLLLTWVPFIGDPLAIASGVMREPLPTFLVLVGITKTARYVVLAATMGWLQ